MIIQEEIKDQVEMIIERSRVLSYSNEHIAYLVLTYQSSKGVVIKHKTFEKRYSNQAGHYTTHSTDYLPLIEVKE